MVIILFLFDTAKITTKLAEFLMKGDRIFLWGDRGKLFYMIFPKCCHSCNRGLMNYKSDRIGWQEPCHPSFHHAIKNVRTFQVKRLGVWVKTLRRFFKMLRHLHPVTGKQDGGRTPATISILCISLLKRCCTDGSKLPFSPIETKNPPRGIPKADFSLYKGFY